jgi:hypothetical protein
VKNLYIKIADDISDKAAVAYVDSVISQGRVSGALNDGYCYATTFRDDVVVIARKTKTGDSFRVFKRGSV